MLKKHWIIINIVTVLSIILVVYMYSKNYISFEGGLHIVLPAKVPENVEISITKEIPAMANIQQTSQDTNLRGKVQAVKPSDESSKIPDEHRIFDDAMKAVETFSPIITPIITFYIFKKKKKLDKNIKDDE